MEQHLPTILSALTLLGLILGFSDRIFKKGKEESNLCDRVTILEKTVSKTSEDITKIKDNHLAHIQADMNSMQKSIAVIENTLKIKFEE